MAKKVGINYDKEHFKRIESYVRKIQLLYLRTGQQAAQLVEGVKYKGEFSFDKFPAVKKKIDKLIGEMNTTMELSIQQMNKTEWMEACYKGDALIALYASKVNIPTTLLERYQSRNMEALAAFQQRKINGLNLSDRVWRYTNQFKGELELALDIGLGEGRSAAQLSRDVRSYLNNPDALFRRVRNKYGNLKLSKHAKQYHPGPGAYRSAYKNAMRLTRTETNMAYRKADYEKNQQFDFVVGIEVKRSNHFFACPVCESLKGRYPKSFVFTGWHPQCYDEASEVYTNNGWKFFKNVKDDDLILSLNPNTRYLEWSGIKLSFKRMYSGDMVHFYNRSLDCLVTPEHEMVYLNKSDGRIKRVSAIEYTKGKGAFFRGANWNGEEIDSITIGQTVLNFDLFAEFMGFWLADGSLIRNSQIKIAQRDGDNNKEKIISCVERLGLSFGKTVASVDCYSRDLNQYLKQFGKSYDKYIPEQIKKASIRQITIFLNAFISCDGHIKKAKAFVGNRGTLCVPKNDERSYCTSSPKLASDIGELILKIGKRPSYRIDKTKGKKQKFRNGVYTINHDQIIITECNSLTATVFEKEIVNYEGYVYDLTLDKNSIMYIRRNGKCFWGSNCRCFSVSILATQEEFIQHQKRLMAGEESVLKSKNEVNGVPEGFKKWVKDNQEKSDSKPYFLKDNESLLRAAR